MPEKKIRRGHCLCGSVQFEVAGEPVVVAHCHCEDCQRLTGTGHLTGAMFSSDGFKLTGRVGEYKLQSDNGSEVTRAFCPSCGSPVFGRNTRAEGFQTIPLGIFDDSSDFRPEVTIFARNCRSWDVVDADTQVFEAQPDWKPK